MGGRGLPLVAADLLKFNLGARRYAGSLMELARPEAPAPVQAQPGPLRLLARKVGRGFGRGFRAARQRRGRRPFRPHGWFGKRRHRGHGDRGKAPREKDTGHRKPWRFSLALSVITLSALAIPAAALADGPWSDDAWRLEEVRALPPDPVPGRRLFLEGLTVIDRTAWVTIRAATDLRLDARSYGGDDGRVLNFFVADHMQQGEAETFGLSLDGPDPSFTFAWQDGIGANRGTGPESDGSLPHPLPTAEGEICESPGRPPWAGRRAISAGVIKSDCAAELEERLDLPVASDGIPLAVGERRCFRERLRA